MDATVSELESRLRELDIELEDGDITRKGYEKRRTQLLSQFLDPEHAQQLRLTVNNPHGDEIVYNSREDGRDATFAALTGGSASPRSPSYRTSMVSAGSPGRTPSGQVGRFHDRELGARHVSSQRSNANLRPLTPEINDYSSRRGTMLESDYRFNPDDHYRPQDDQGRPSDGSPGGASRLSTMQGYFSDFAGQQAMDQPRDSYGGPNRYSYDPAFSPSLALPTLPVDMTDHQSPGIIESQSPLEPRDIPFEAFDPHDPHVSMTKFDNIGAVLRHRGKTNGRQPAYWVLDQKGKEVASITWEKLASRAEKVAQVIKEKSNLYRGDRVALVYRDAEVIDFAIALLGCFLAGVVAVPMNNVEDYQKLSLLLTTTQAHLALTTDNNLKAFHRDISTQKLKWPTGVEWWKTNEFGSYHAKRKDDGPQLPTPDLAYIEFSRAPTGDLRGVVLSHRTIMHQMACVQAIIGTIPVNERQDTFNASLRRPDGSYIAAPRRTGPENILTYLDPREGVGLILGVLFGVYGGHTTIWMEAETVETPGLYAHLVTRYRTTVMVADYPGLKRTAYNYQQDPMATRNFKKNTEPNFASVKICLIDTLTVDVEFHEVLADRWLRPMRNPRARELVAPMLCLPEHGGMIISMRDWLGGEENMGCPLNTLLFDDDEKDEKPATMENKESTAYSGLIGGMKTTKSNGHRSGPADLIEVLLDKEALKMNQVVVVGAGEDVQKRANEPNVLRCGSFGYPIPDATLAVVDPETNLLCPPYVVGELWVDSPSLSGGFWALPKHTETIFHARPYRFIDGSPTPILVEPEFLRTGLLGCVIEGKVFVLGLYEDRIRQKVEWVDNFTIEPEHRYYFVQHLVVSIMKNVLKIYDCSAFDCHVNGEYLPIILIETQAASTAPTTTGGPPQQLNIPFLDSLAERVMQVLYTEQHLRVFCVMVTAPKTLPRIIKNGRREIGNMLCRKEFDTGTLACVHVKFGVERSVQNLPVGDDVEGGIWSPLATQSRMQLLGPQEKQYSGVDYREVVIDDRTSTPLNSFSNIHDLMQWRVSRHGEELAFCTIDTRGKEGKGVNWKKFDLKVSAVAVYLKNKIRINPGDHLILMYTHSEDYVYAVHACIALGAVAIPLAPIDQNRLNEDAPALLHLIADYGVKAILVNNDVDGVMKAKLVAQHIKQSAQYLKINMPGVFNTSKPSKQNHGCREQGLTIRPNWVQPGYPVLIWVYWTPDQRRSAVQLSHDTIMAVCKVQKETCQMTSSRAVIGCVRSTVSLGFIHTCLMGIYLAVPTYLVSPVDFSQNPNILFQTLSKYKIKDAYATSQMLDHAMVNGAGKTAALHELKNLMITTEGRPNLDVWQKVRLHFATAALDRTSINTVYSHILNPMITSRSYMCIEPCELWLNRDALRRGLVVPVSPDNDADPLLVQDSGMVPVCTQISIVNPDTRMLCATGEYGEIWVQSEANVHGFHMSKDPLDKERFSGQTVDGDPHVRYMRTGDIGFLHTVARPIGPGGALVEMQILFVLGSLGETIEINGLNHFPMDIEDSVEKCHRNIVPGGCAVFQAGGLVVVIVEVQRRSFLASIVPVIVNAVLNGHHIIVDIVSFVFKGDFPRSRLGEKQRGKILATWVTRKMRTIAQFGIRDPDAAEALMGVPEEDTQARNMSMSTGRHGSTLSRQMGSNHTRFSQANTLATQGPSPGNHENINAYEQSSIIAETPLSVAIPLHSGRSDDDSSGADEDTPTESVHRTGSLPPHVQTTLRVANEAENDSPIDTLEGPYARNEKSLSPPRAHQTRPQSDIWGLPSQQRKTFYDDDDDDEQPGSGEGGLRIMNRNSTLGNDDSDDDDWRNDALRQLQLAGRTSRQNS